MRINVFGMLFLGSVYSASVFSADSIRSGLAKCSIVEGSVERLACFDSVVANNSIGMKVEATSGGSKWRSRTKTNPLDDSKTVSLMLAAETGVSGYRNRPVLLLIRCKSNETDLFVSWDNYLGRDASVISRIGKGKAERLGWGMSTNSKATFKDAPISFIKKMMKADKLVLQTTPYNESPITAEFDITGLEEEIKPLREACNW